MSKTHHRRLLLMAALSFISMYVLMYAMVGAFAHVFANFNQFYMAALMTAPTEDAEIKDLCSTIISGQQAEIDQMKVILSELEK